MQIHLILALIFALLVAAFAIQNTALVTINFLFWEGSISLVLVILGSVAAGGLLFFVLGVIKQLANKRERKEMRKVQESLNTQLAEAKRQLEAAEAQLRETARARKELKADIEAQEAARTEAWRQPEPAPGAAAGAEMLPEMPETGKPALAGEAAGQDLDAAQAAAGQEEAAD